MAKATRAAAFLVITVARLPFGVLAGTAYAFCEHATGLPVLPMNKWLDSPLQHSWTLNVTTITVVGVIYVAITLLQTYLTTLVFEANRNFRRIAGYERDHVE